MALLAEYALTPDVFDSRSYPHEEVGSARIDLLRDVLLEEALVRDLRQGDWLSVFGNPDRSWNRRGLELLKKVAKQNRLRRVPSALADAPTDDDGWCREAIASHGLDPVTGIIATRPVFDAAGGEDIVGCIDRLSNSTWWTGRGSSVRLQRTAADYSAHLNLLMRCANSIMLIDAHMDPAQPRYADVLNLIQLAAGRQPLPLVEIHRVCYVGTGRNRQILQPIDIENSFRQGWEKSLSACGLSVSVFVWDDFHDRHIITDLMGIQLGNGLDTTLSSNARTTWTRISRADRDDIQREFDQASGRHALRHHFRVPR